MNAYASSSDRNDPFSPFSRRIEELMGSVEEEIRHAVTYVDSVVVPEVRREAGGAARALAQHLERLADRLHPLQDRDWDRDGAPDGKRGL